jgi:hypothetical protein
MDTSRYFYLLVAVQQMGANGAFLRDVCLLVPVDGSVWTTVHQFLDSLRLDSVNQYDTILANRYVVRLSLYAGSILAVLARHRQIADIDARVMATFGLKDIHPSMAVPGLFIRVGKPLIGNVLILTGEKAVIAVVTN